MKTWFASHKGLILVVVTMLIASIPGIAVAIFTKSEKPIIAHNESSVFEDMFYAKEATTTFTLPQKTKEERIIATSSLDILKALMMQKEASSSPLEIEEATTTSFATTTKEIQKILNATPTPVAVPTPTPIPQIMPHIERLLQNFQGVEGEIIKEPVDVSTTEGIVKQFTVRVLISGDILNIILIPNAVIEKFNAPTGLSNPGENYIPTTFKEIKKGYRATLNLSEEVGKDKERYALSVSIRKP